MTDSDEHAAEAALRGFFGRDALYLGLWAVQFIGAALFTPITSRVLGAPQFGSAAAATAVMQVLFAVGGFGMQTAVQRVYSDRGPAAARVTVTTATAIATGVCLVAYLSGPLWAGPVGFGHFSFLVREAIVWGWLTAIANAGLGLLRSTDRLVAFAVATLLQSVAGEGLGLAFVLIGPGTARDYLKGLIIAQALTGLWVLVCVGVDVPRRRDRPLLAQAIAFGAGLVPAGLAQLIIDTSDRLIIHADLGSVATARYYVARNIGGFVGLVLALVNFVWMPRVFSLEDGPALTTVLRTSRNAVYALLAPLNLGLGAIGPFLLVVWVPPSYGPLGVQVVLSLTATATCFYAASTAATRVLLRTGHTGFVGGLTGLTAGVNVALNLLLVPSLGVNGSALASLGSYAVLAFSLNVAAQRFITLPRTPVRLFTALALSASIGLLLTQAPVFGLFILVRAALALLAAAWGAVVLMAILAPERLPRVAPTLRRLLDIPDDLT